NSLDVKARECRRFFLRHFPRGFYDQKYLEWERGYKWAAHEQWRRTLDRQTFKRLLADGDFAEIAARAVRLESATNLLFSFEKMALRDAVRPAAGARAFSQGLFDFVYGGRRLERRFERFAETLEALPRRQTRVLTWPLQTVFGFIAAPREHIFLKPMVTRRGAEAYGFDFRYRSLPNWETYASLLEFAEVLRRDLSDMEPRDMIDLQSFIWVLGSDEYL
ncbi:MAG TPA: hypothetical protein VF754_01195, partial [Pyrinomonadaceae bacterium]